MTTAAAPVLRDLQLEPAELAFYNEQGYLPLPGFIRAEAVDRLVDEVYEALEATSGRSRAAFQTATSAADRLSQCNKYLAGSLLDTLINGEATLSIASQLIGGKAHRYLPFTAVKPGGGGGTFDYHQDNNYTQHEPATGSINIWVALVDMTTDNGCLRVIPGSHKRGQWESRNSDFGDNHRKIDVDPDTLLPVRMRAGDAVAFTRWTVHGSGPNTTDAARVAYALQYHRQDVKFLDKQDGRWKLLVENPRWSTGPVESYESR